MTVLTGANGSGKSTALQAILGLAEPAEGAVRVGGVDVAYLDRTRWWDRIAWLPQHPVLVPGTLGENLALVGPWIPGPTRFTAPVEQPDSTRFSPSSHAGGTPSSGSVAPASRSASGSASR